MNQADDDGSTDPTDPDAAAEVAPDEGTMDEEERAEEASEESFPTSDPPSGWAGEDDPS